VIRKETLLQLDGTLHMTVYHGANAAELFNLVAVGGAKRECQDQVLSPDERKRVMEWLAQAQGDCPILKRVPYYRRGCAADMPMGYVMVQSNGEVNPCMLLQVKLGNIREQSIMSIWGNSPVLAELRQRELLKGQCGGCSYKVICSGCRGRAYEETGEIMAADPGCWLAADA
jgi:radical SAM protein with 4Fe4S-binding SPASM domain